MKSLYDVIKYLAACYPNANIGPETLAAFGEALQHAPIDQLELAARQHVLHSKFFPTIAELMSQIVGAQLPAGAELSPEQAWTRVAAAMPGHYDDAECYREAREEVGDFLWGIVDSVGGWHALQTGRAEDMRIGFARAFLVKRDRLVATARTMLSLPEGEQRAALSG